MVIPLSFPPVENLPTHCQRQKQEQYFSKQPKHFLLLLFPLTLSSYSSFLLLLPLSLTTYFLLHPQNIQFRVIKVFFLVKVNAPGSPHAHCQQIFGNCKSIELSEINVARRRNIEKYSSWQKRKAWKVLLCILSNTRVCKTGDLCSRGVLTSDKYYLSAPVAH